MFYRRKVIMSILQKWGRELPLTDFQKILFLFTQKQGKPSFDFVPYSYGGFSFLSYADKRTMIKYGLLKNNEHRWASNDSTDFISTLDSQDKENLNILYSEIRTLQGKNLVRYVYKKYPYYAIKSQILDILSKEERNEVEKEIPKMNNFELFTIGYEGKSVEAYLNLLIKNNVKVLCDVRKNPISMKYGFSKKQLIESTKKVDIVYVHIPQLGIESDKRQNLDSKIDYEILFSEYEKSTLPQQTESLLEIEKLIKNYKRIALTCFEADPEFCHRSRVASALLKLPGWKFPLQHL